MQPYCFAQKLAAVLDQRQPEASSKRKKSPSVNYMPYVLSGLAAGLPAVILAGKFMRTANNQYNKEQARLNAQPLPTLDELKSNAQRYAQQRSQEYQNSYAPRIKLERKAPK